MAHTEISPTMFGDGISMLVAGFDNYVACRACWRANCLFQAAILAEQSLEKLFKGGQRLSGNSTPFKQKKGVGMGHELHTFAQFEWFDTSPFGNLIAELEYHFFNSRYPKTSEDADVLVCRRGISAEDFHKLDDLVLTYMDSLPLYERLKHSLGVYAEYYNAQLFRPLGLDQRWQTLTWDNLRLAARAKAIEEAVAKNKLFLEEHGAPGIYRSPPANNRIPSATVAF